MSGVRLVNVVDAARSLGAAPTKATPEGVRDWFLAEYLPKRGGSFNYDPAINITYDAFRGGFKTEKEARVRALSIGNPKGRSANADAISCVAPYALANVSTCYRTGFMAVAAGRVKGRTIYLAIKSSLVRVTKAGAFVVMPGYRMSHRPNEVEIDVSSSIGLATIARGDFVGADFEYLYAGPNVAGVRELRVIHGRDRTIYDLDAIDSMLDVYARGIALVIEAGADLHEPDLAGYKIVDPREPPLF